jgi:hypothetical protein
MTLLDDGFPRNPPGDDDQTRAMSPEAELAAALAVAATGLPVFPCDADKRPLVSGGFKSASKDPQQIATWWRQWPAALIGVPTGASSGFFVIDLDSVAHGGPDGLVAWDKLTAIHAAPPTRTHATPNGGLHLLFRYDPQRPVTNRRGDLPAGIDVRGEGGYVVFPPSRLPDGRAWRVPENCETDGIAAAPEWLYELIAGTPAAKGTSGKPPSHIWRSKDHDYPCTPTGAEWRKDSDGRIYARVVTPDGIEHIVPKDELVPAPRRSGTANGNGNGAYAEAALADELAAVARAGCGQRNETLNRAAFNLGQLVGARALSGPEVESRLFGAAQASGLVSDDGERTVRATIASGLEAGMRQPREIPDTVGSAQAKLDERPRPIGDEQKVVYAPRPFEPRDPTKFPRRQFLYGRHYARKYVSMTVAAGDVGKTTLALTEAIAMAAHRPLLGVHFRQALRVWYWNGEDPREEIDRRALAICERHKIDQQSLVRNLFLDSGRDTKIVVAEMVGRTGFKIVVPVKEALIAALVALRIDILIVDPFVKTHRVSENDNVFMDAVATVFADIADAANCAVELVQHTRKTNGEEVTLEDARGAGSTTAAARMVRTLNRMPKANAPLAGIKEEQARYYVRVDDGAKSNLAPPQKATWFHLANVGLGNFGPEPALDEEDHVQVASNGTGRTPSGASATRSCARSKDRSTMARAARTREQGTG